MMVTMIPGSAAMSAPLASSPARRARCFPPFQRVVTSTVPPLRMTLGHIPRGVATIRPMVAGCRVQGAAARRPSGAYRGAGVVPAAAGSSGAAAESGEKVSDAMVGALYKVCTAIFAGWFFLQMITAPQLFFVSPAWPVSWHVAFAQSLGVLVFIAATSCWTLGEATRKSLLKSETYKTLNLGMGGFFLVYGFLHLTAGPLVETWAAWGGAAVAAVGGVVATKGYFGAEKDWGDGAAVLEWEYKGFAILLAALGLVVYFSPGSVMAAFPGMAEGYGGLALSRWMARDVGAYLLPVVAATHVCGSAAGRGRLGASTFQQLSKALVVFAVLGLWSAYGIWRAGYALPLFIAAAVGTEVLCLAAAGLTLVKYGK